MAVLSNTVSEVPFGFERNRCSDHEVRSHPLFLLEIMVIERQHMPCRRPMPCIASKRWFRHKIAVNYGLVWMRDTLISFFSTSLFLNFGVPLISVAFSIFIKAASRNDAHKPLKMEDFAFGFDLIVASLLLLVTSCARFAAAAKSGGAASAPHIEKLEEAPYVLIVMVIFTWGLSTVVRKVGWQGEDNLRPVTGMVIPCIFGILILWVTVTWTSI